MDVDLGLLIIRFALGPMLAIHGANKAFGPGGLSGTARWFESIGLRPAWLHARLASVVEIGAGVMLTVGLVTAPVAAAYVGLMAVAALTDHRGKGYFVFKGGAEYVVLVAMVAIGIASAGPGQWSLDAALGLDFQGVWWAVAAGAVGVVSAGALTAAAHRPGRA